MDEDEKALLAELRAISLKSAARDRFGDADDDEDDRDDDGANDNLSSSSSAQQPGSPQKNKQADIHSSLVHRHAGAALPPWKQQQQQRRKSTSSPSQTAPNEAPNEAPNNDGATVVQEPKKSEPAVVAEEKKLADEPEEPEKATVVPKNSRANLPLPPWKRKMITVTVESSISEEEIEVLTVSDSRRQPSSTLQGERGGAAQDAELLALLRGVSNKSSASRFGGEDNTAESCANEQPLSQSEQAAKEPLAEEPVIVESNAVAKPKNRLTPPWKRKAAVGAKSDAELMVAAPPRLVVGKEAEPPSNGGGGGIKSDRPSTFQGERGGAAEDAELLALLRGVSSNSAASRFDDEEGVTAAHEKDFELHNDGSVKNLSPQSQVQEEVTAAKPKKRLTPPWKRKASVAAKFDDVEVLVAAPSPPEKIADQPVQSPLGGGIKSELPSTFQGDRGGAAEDAELLALLRGVSNMSATSRFDNGGIPADEPQAPELQNVPPEQVTEPTKPNKSILTPPWKRKPPNVVAKKDADVVVIAAPLVAETQEEPTRAIKSELPSTFNGDRGGAAEDAELLALLRGVSNKSASSRFGDSDEPAKSARSITTDEPAAADAKSKAKLPPWKRAAKRAASENRTDAEVVVASPPQERVDASVQVVAPNHGIKTELTSTFKGDRGGAAEDIELLALLRGVSTQSSAGRFSDAASDQTAPSSVAAIQTTAKPTAPTSLGAALDPHGEGAAIMARENIPKSLSDKNWKVRCQAYDVLATILQELADAANELVESDAVLEGLDDRMPGFVEDKNAGALDKAMEFANLYAEYCRGAGDAEQARKIVSSLVKKNAFSSKPSTLKLASTLTLKLMEVGWGDGASSVHSVVDVLLTEGLASKKPKVIQASASLILEAAYHFGAASLPLASITSASPKMLCHSNATVRDCCVKILAEICRALGSKTPIQSVTDGMKKAQLSELDTQLSEQPEATPIRTGLRSSKQGSGSSSPEDALAALQAGSKELQAQRFAARPAVNLVAAVAKTDYASQITLPKWSEKVAALDKVLECGGEKPYKLSQPSSSINYGPLIVDMKKLLSHTHFAVCSKAIQVLSMLAEGVGEKLYPYLRPALTPLIQLSKDKKLTNAVSSGLDSLFGNVLSFESLLDGDDAIPSAVDEKLQKNALARVTALGYLRRCVERNDAAGPKGMLSSQSAFAVANLCTRKLDDSDASVRKAAMDVLESLQQFDDKDISEKVQMTIETLQTSNPRAYKTLSKGTTDVAVSARTSVVSSGRPVASAPVTTKLPSVRNRSAAPPKKAPPPPPPTAPAPIAVVPAVSASSYRSESTKSNERPMPRLEDALVHVTSLGIPQWDASEEEGGILVGLRASKWQLRHDAIESLRSYVESGHLDDSSPDVELSSSSILVVVREQTRGFKETNVNIMKAILQFFIAICEFCESKELPLGSWAVRDAASVCVQKISDRKLSGSCHSLLTAVCVVSLPSALLLAAFEELKSVKSPVAHEELLKWFQTFCADFGAVSVGPGISDVIPHLLEELGSSNVKVKREATCCFGLLHQQVGPGLKALAISLAKLETVKDLLQKCFDENPFDSSMHSTCWRRTSIVGWGSTSNGQGQSSSIFALDVPKTDLFATLPPDIVLKLGSKDGKTAWKMRKEAMDEIDTALNSCSGLIVTSPPQMKQLAELTRGLRDRLSDTQINLRPTAARLAGSLLHAVEKGSQARLGKLVLAPLINAAMNDIKKPMRDASLAAIRTGITASSLDGGDLNELALEALVSALVAEVNEAAIRAGGLPDVLLLLLSVADSLPNLDTVVAARGQSLGEKYAAVLVECLTSSKLETRSAALSLLEASVENGVVSKESIKKATERLKPALQRSVGALIANMAKNAAVSSQAEEENVSSRKKTDAARDQPVPSENSQRLRSNVPVPAANAKSPGRRKEDHAESTAPSHHPIMSSTHPRHPLIPSSGKHVAGSTRNIIWPEYPEEPHGSVLENLKRFWAPFLPPATVSALFPIIGMKKQDDAKCGIEALTRALSIDRASGSTALEEQLDLVLKWITFALCLKESTTGLQDILSLLKDIFAFMLEIHRELTDAEALETIPFLLDKVSSAKGRFRDTYMEINALVESEALLPPKRLGMVCIAMIDSSPHAKAKAQACHTCITCVEKTGLAAGVGKKGVLSAAKMLSQETTTYRSAALDLMEVILSKMNGDIQRLVRICGPSLSDKARLLLEERWHKGHAKETAPSSVAIGSPRRRSQGGSPQKSPITGFRSGTQSDIYDELPRLSLRAGGKEAPKPSPRMQNAVLDTSDDPFAFVFSTRRATSPSNLDTDQAATADTGNVYSSLASSTIEPSGAAAALRARLLKIREKGKIPENGVAAVEEDLVQEGIVVESCDDLNTVTHKPIDFEIQMDAIRNLLNRCGPIAEKDPELQICVAALKTLHAALSRQQHSAVGLTAAQLSDFRVFLINNMNGTVDLLRRLIGFTIHSGDEQVNAGMLLPLLSLCLATLMALFRDSEFASKVSSEELTLLIRETGTALLDTRLSSSDELNEGTRTQMVRGINKLAVQAATGSLRHASFQALMTLQQQLNFESTDDDSNDEAFKSRLSRVVTKLFARVIRAEEATDSSYTLGTLDMEALICSMEDLLAACKKAEGDGESESAEVCRDMVKSLILSILGVHGDAAPLRQQMDELGIDSQGSVLGALVSACAEEIGLSEKPNVENQAKLQINSTTPPSSDAFTRAQPKTPSKDVASLVARLGCAPPGAERESALEAIRIYKSTYGGEELDAHLQQLSGAFRDFIEDQIKGDSTPQKQPPVEHAGTSVSERIRNLRSRLQASELAVQTAVEDRTPEPTASRPKPSLPPTKPASPHKVAAPTSNLIAPSPSKLPQPSPSKLVPTVESRLPAPGQSRLPSASSSSAQSLRERLSARQELRLASETSSANESAATSSKGRAAVLRARLEAVKQQSKQEQN